jgi:hypothetical protein
MAENEQRHSHEQDRADLEMDRVELTMSQAVLSGDSRRSYLGIGAGFIIGSLGLVGSVYLVANGHDWAGFGIAGTDLASPVGVFIYGTRAQRSDRQRHSQDQD